MGRAKKTNYSYTEILNKIQYCNCISKWEELLQIFKIWIETQNYHFGTKEITINEYTVGWKSDFLYVIHNNSLVDQVIGKDQKFDRFTKKLLIERVLRCNTGNLNQFIFSRLGYSYFFNAESGTVEGILETLDINNLYVTAIKCNETKEEVTLVCFNNITNEKTELTYNLYPEQIQELSKLTKVTPSVEYYFGNPVHEDFYFTNRRISEVVDVKMDNIYESYQEFIESKDW